MLASRYRHDSIVFPAVIQRGHHPVSASSSIAIRPAIPSDIAFITEMYELVEGTGAPHWRTDGSTPNPYSTDWITTYFERSPDNQMIFVAADERDAPLGYIWVLTLTDFDAHLPHGHIAGVAVSPHAGGKGIGRTLVGAAEVWCQSKQVAEITLHCYMGNERAHALYHHLGYEDEWYQMRKAL